MAKGKIKDTEDDEKTTYESFKSNGSSNMIIYGLMVFLFILVIIALILAGIGLSNVPEKWSWNGKINVETVQITSDNITLPTGLDKAYNVLLIKNISNNSVSETLSVANFTGSDSKKVLRVVNDTLSSTITLSGFTSSPITSIYLNSGEYAEFLQQSTGGPKFMGVSSNTQLTEPEQN